MNTNSENITEEQREQCENAIHEAALLAEMADIGLPTTAMGDNVIITDIQKKLIREVGTILNRTVTNDVVKDIISNARTVYVGRNIFRIWRRRICAKKGEKNPAITVRMTEEIGWMAVKELKGGYLT